MKREKSHLYIQKKKTYTVKIINKEIFVCIDVDDRFWNFVFFFYTQLDGFVGFFTSHNCEILMSH